VEWLWKFLDYDKARISHEYRNGFFSIHVQKERERGIYYIKSSFCLCCLRNRTISSFFFYFPEIHFSCGIFYTVFSLFSLPILTSCLWSCLHYILFEVSTEFIIWFAKGILAVSLWSGY
jgi:hypothetical protein